MGLISIRFSQFFVFNCLVSLIFSSGYVGFFIVFVCLVVKFCVFLIDFDIWVCGFLSFPVLVCEFLSLLVGF